MSAPERGEAHSNSALREVDAALQDTLALLEAVRQEEQVLARLGRCIVELESIFRARSALRDITDAELTEAGARSRSQGDGRADAAAELDR